MKRKNVERHVKKAIALTLALTLTVPMATPAFTVEAQEIEVADETQETEAVEEKDYVVYIDMTAETSDAENGDMMEEGEKSQNTISENSISENALYEENEDRDNETSELNEEVEVANVQESIEKAEEILSEDGAELVKDEETIIYTADLTQNEIQELQESEASIVVEENIELFGAGKKNQINSKKESKKENKEKEKKNTKEKETKKSEMDKEKPDNSEKKRSKAYELKMAMKQSGSETEKEEPEWNVSMVNGDVAGQVEGETVKVAVMDSGIELLSGIPVQEINNLVASEQNLPYYMNDMTGHGTAIAGIINDIAPNAEIYSVKIMDAENKATLSRVVEGIYWCIDNDIDIINMSFGTTVQSVVLEKAIKDANAAGILIVSSAGNGDTAGVEYPAAYEEVIAVGAVNTSAEKTEESAVGEEVELVAPGEQILSDSMLGLETVVSGTSMAAPHVTAAAAVLWQKDKTKSPAFIRSLLAQTANELGDTEEYGNGLIDLEYALLNYEEFAKKYQESEKNITSQEGTSIKLEDELKSQTESDNTSPIVEAEEQLVKENTTAVETYEDVDYVEGRWGEQGHWGLLNYAKGEWESCGITFGATEIEAFKRGAVYPDEVFKVKNDPNDTKAYRAWHGGYSKNYVANYRFCTRMAKYAGNMKNYKKAKGQSDYCYEEMAERVNSTRIKGSTTRTWEQIAAQYNLTYTGEKFRKYFIYGMASHIVTDTFCHSAYVKKGGKYVKLKDLDIDDKPNEYPNRYKDAQEAMSMVLLNCYYGDMGSEIDFSPRVEDWGKNRDYYLRNILKYTKKSAVDWTDKELEKAYKAINYEE